MNRKLNLCFIESKWGTEKNILFILTKLSQFVLTPNDKDRDGYW